MDHQFDADDVLDAVESEQQRCVAIVTRELESFPLEPGAELIDGAVVRRVFQHILNAIQRRL